MNKAMRNILVIAGAAVVMVAVAAISGILLERFSGREQTVAPETLTAVANFTRGLQARYGDAMAISATLDEAEAAVTEGLGGAALDEAVASSVLATLEQATGAIDAFEGNLANIGVRPRIGDSRDSGLRAYEDMVRGLTVHLRSQHALLRRELEAAQAGDLSGFDRLRGESFGLARTMIEAENIALEVGRYGVGSDHPQGSLIEATIGANLSAMAGLMLAEDWLRDEPVRLAAILDLSRQGVDRATRALAEGREKSARLRDRLGDDGPVVDGQSFAQALYDAYERAFAIEDGIVAAMRSLNDALAQADPAHPDAEALSAAGDAFRGAIADLVARRMVEQNARLVMMEDVAGRMAAGQ